MDGIERRGAFTTSDGIRLAYRVGGNPNGPPMLFAYGLLCSNYHFKYQWDFFKDRFRLLAVDYRGHHISEDPAAVTTLTFPRMVEDLSEFLEDQGVRRPVTLVGHSMGVNLALEFYERFAERVEALVLMAGAATFPVKRPVELQRLRFAQSLLRVLDGIFPKLVDRFWRFQGEAPGADQIAGLVGFNPRLSKPEDIHKVVQVMSGLSPKVFFQLLGEYIRHDRSDTLPRISVPTLIIGGERDRMVPARFQEFLRDRIPGSRYVSIAEGSHCPQFDRPDEVNEAMKMFLNRGQDVCSRGAAKILPS